MKDTKEEVQYYKYLGSRVCEVSRMMSTIGSESGG